MIKRLQCISLQCGYVVWLDVVKDLMSDDLIGALQHKFNVDVSSPAVIESFMSLSSG